MVLVLPLMGSTPENKMGGPAREPPIMTGLPKSFFVTDYIGHYAEKL
jgi:hypothetical protein